MTKPRLLKAHGSVWQCRSDEFWGTGFSPKEAWVAWVTYMEKHGHL